MTRSDHPLFARFPLNEQVKLSAGDAPAPYHIYDGYGLFIGGTADLGAVRTLLQGEQVRPIETVQGRAVMGIWVCDFTAASLGPHHELQFSIFVSAQPVAPLDDHPLSLLQAMLTRPELQMLCHGLWNDTRLVVAYNREWLGLNARLAQSRIASSPSRLEFAIHDTETGVPVLSGEVQAPRQAGWRATADLMARIGLRRLWASAAQPWVTMRVVNPIGAGLERNAVAQAFNQNSVNRVRYFGPETGTLEFGATPYRALQFAPQFVQYMEGFKFVYLKPE